MTRAGFTIRALMLSFGIAGVTTHAQDFKARAGKSEIQISPDMWPLEGLTSPHDPLTVRVLLMDDGKARTAIVVLEQPSISEGTITGVKTSLTKLAGVSPENAIVVGTHTTSAPHANMGALGGGNARPAGTNAGPGGPQGAGNAGGPARGPGAAAFAKALSDAKVYVLNRRSLKVLSTFGGAGRAAGQFDVAYNLAVDSKGDFFITETGEGKRVQRFVLSIQK